MRQTRVFMPLRVYYVTPKTLQPLLASQSTWSRSISFAARTFQQKLYWRIPRRGLWRRRALGTRGNLRACMLGDDGDRLEHGHIG